MTDFGIRPFEESDLSPVLDLLKASLGENEVLRRSPDLFAWKHTDNPFGPSIMLVAEDRNGLAGFRAFMRWELETTSGQLLRCVRPVDTATHPRARRRGIFRRLSEEAVEAARRGGVDLIFNTPNLESGAGYLRMGWQQVGTIGVMIRPLGGFFRPTSGFPSVGGTARWGDREPAVRPPRGLRTPRRADYLKWRFAQHPTARYTVSEQRDGNMAVLRSNRRNERAELVVSDLFGPDPAPAVRQAARATDAAYLVTWAPPGSPERGALLRAGLVPVPKKRALTLFARPLTPLAAHATRFGEWDLMLSDLELL